MPGLRPVNLGWAPVLLRNLAMSGGHFYTFGFIDIYRAARVFTSAVYETVSRRTRTKFMIECTLWSIVQG